MIDIYKKRSACDPPFMRKGGCFDAAQIFTYALTALFLVLVNRVKTAGADLPDVTPDSIPLSMRVRVLLLECLHPLPQHRPSVASLQEYLMGLNK